MDKVKFTSLRPGIVLGDYHNVGPMHSLTEMIQERIKEPIEISSPVVLQGEWYQWIDAILKAELGSKAHQYTNKNVVVLQYCRSSDLAYTIGYSWDGLWLALRTLSLRE